MSRRAETGRCAEDRALAHLEASGLRLRARNVRSRWGELDLVMENEEAIVFVEVRYRQHGDFGGAAASVDGRKRGKLIRSAHDYLARARLGDRPARFDVVALSGDGSIDWIPGAFDAD